jgi:hypothetical protein
MDHQCCDVSRQAALFSWCLTITRFQLAQFPLTQILAYVSTRKWGDFSLLRSNSGGTFRLHFWNLPKI